MGRMNQEELTLTIRTLCLELYFKVVLLMKVCVQAIWENVATKVKLLLSCASFHARYAPKNRVPWNWSAKQVVNFMCKLSCKVCSQESCSLELECKAGGKFHVKLNICLRLKIEMWRGTHLPFN